MTELSLPPGAHDLRRVLAEARVSWRRSVTARAALQTGSAAIGCMALLLILDLLFPLSVDVRSVLRWTPLIAALSCMAAAVRRLIMAPDDRKLALLVEERYPHLESTLSTLIDLVGESTVALAFRQRSKQLLPDVRAADAVPLPGRPLTITFVLAAVALALGLTLTGGGAEGAWQRWIQLRATETGVAIPSSFGPPAAGGPTDTRLIDLSAVRVTIDPPAYTGSPPSSWEDGRILTALNGSRLSVTGMATDTSGLRVRVIGGSQLAVGLDDGQWSAGWTLNSGERGLELEVVASGEIISRRIIPLAVLPDRPPVVDLVRPDQDLVLAAPRGTIEVHGRATDDFEVAEFHLSWIRSRGSGESFSFEEGRWEWGEIRTTEDMVEGRLSLDLAALDLLPGDILHVRALARDRNTVTGPGEGVSRARIIRIARQDEMGEVTTLTGFPIEAERDPILSQRMIILLTERLIETAPTLAPAELQERAEGVADEQGRLRLAVGEQALAPSIGAEEAHDHEAHNHDADPILSVNQGLLDAYNLMWTAEGSLRIVELRESLPHQYEALRILQEAREASRVFVRGRVEVAPVDVSETRGTGKLDEVEPAPRTSQAPSADREDRLAELESLLSRLRELDSDVASVELGGLAARLLSDPGIDPAAAALLVEAAEVARLGELGQAAELLVLTRSLLVPGGALEDAVPTPAIPAGDAAAAYYFRHLGRP